MDHTHEKTEEQIKTIQTQQDHNAKEQCRIWDEFDNGKEACNQSRRECIKEINEKFDHRPTTGTLLTIAGIFFGVIIAVIVTLSSVQGGKIEDLQKTDSRISKIQEETTKELREIKESLIRFEAIIKKH